jgi:geranylgeranyl diphosphate synthase, type I
MGTKASRIMKTFTELAAQIKNDIDVRLQALLKAEVAQAARYGKETRALVESVESLCARGGKRLRPALAHVGALAVNPDAKPALTRECGLSLELLQAYFLIHDDWMDQDDERRGGPTAHIQLAKAFRSQELGDRAAILAGDYAIALAQQLLSKAKIPAASRSAALSVFAHMQLQAVLGQQRDIMGASDPEVTYELKTASYTVLGPLLLGVAAAGGNRATEKALSSYAKPAGIAFQLRDDLMGVFGDPAVTGKPVGGDLTAGKQTALLSEGLKRLGPAASKELKAVVGVRAAARRKVERAVALLEESGARETIENRISKLRNQALRYARATSISGPAQALLKEATLALTARQA